MCMMESPWPDLANELERGFDFGLRRTARSWVSPSGRIFQAIAARARVFLRKPSISLPASSPNGGRTAGSRLSKARSVAAAIIKTGE